LSKSQKPVFKGGLKNTIETFDSFYTVENPPKLAGAVQVLEGFAEMTLFGTFAIL